MAKRPRRQPTPDKRGLATKLAARAVEAKKQRRIIDRALGREARIERALARKAAAGLPPSKRQQKSRNQSQRARVRRVLPKLYPDGVSDDVSTETVRARVAAELAPESKNLGLADPSWETVHRELGRKT